MSTFPEETEARSVKVTDEALTVDLDDGRTISVPLEWYPRLCHASQSERNNWDVTVGIHIHWPDLDEDISVEGLLKGHRSSESEQSFKRWLAAKNSGCTGENLSIDKLREHRSGLHE